MDDKAKAIILGLLNTGDQKSTNCDGSYFYWVKRAKEYLLTDEKIIPMFKGYKEEGNGPSKPSGGAA